MLPTTKITPDESMLTQSLSSYSLNHKKLIRRGSEHSLVNYSLTSSEQLAKDKTRSLEKSITKSGKKKGNKKADTFGGRATPTCNSLHASPNRSNMYFGSSPTHTPAHAHHLSGGGSSGNITSGGGSGDIPKTPKKSSRWTNIRNKMGKKFRGSVSSEAEDGTGKYHHHHRTKPQRSQSIPSSRKGAVYASARNASVSGDDLSGISYPDGAVGGVGGAAGVGGGVAGSMVVPPRHRKSSSSYTNNVNLVAKIFAVLNCWVDDYFEVS